MELCIVVREVLGFKILQLVAEFRLLGGLKVEFSIGTQIESHSPAQPKSTIRLGDPIFAASGDANSMPPLLMLLTSLKVYAQV